jgi:hypothetical protein
VLPGVGGFIGRGPPRHCRASRERKGQRGCSHGRGRSLGSCARLSRLQSIIFRWPNPTEHVIKVKMDVLSGQDHVSGHEFTRAKRAPL